MLQKISQKMEKTFKEWYDSLPANKQTPIREEIIERCDISPKTFYRWRSGETIPSKLEKEAIICLVGETLEFRDFTAELLENLNMVKH
jgi:hypothetical protein